LSARHGPQLPSMRLTQVFFFSFFLLLTFYAFDQYKHNFYVFDPEVLQSIAKTVIARNLTTQQMIKQLTKELEIRYPGHIDSFEEWMFNNAGGAMGAMTLLHCSVTEYVIIFGTPVGTEGHTGRFFVDDYFIILEGEQWAFAAGQLDRDVYKAGDMHHLVRGHAQQYRMPDKCFALEYARGVIPTMLPFGIWDTFFSTLDFHTLAVMFYYYAKLVVVQLTEGKI